MFNIEPIKLLSGSHKDTAQTGQGCFMNVIAYLNGESQITDKSSCVCITIRPIAIFLNDFANDAQRQKLLPFVLRAMGTATDDKVIISKRIEAVVKFAEFNARLAESAAEPTKSAAEYAKYAEIKARHKAISEEIFNAGLEFLEMVCNPAQEYNQTIINRANDLMKLNSVMA